MNPPIINAESLWRRRNEKNLVVLYTRLADIKSGELEAIDNKVILNAQLFDFEKSFIDENATQPHTMCSADKFSKLARNLGIYTNTQIVVYDSKGLYCAPRVWWMFKSMGHDNIQVLDGGINAWLNAGYEVSSTLSTSASVGDFRSHLNSASFVSTDVIKEHLFQSPKHTILDARTSERFRGISPEPRKGIRSGHIPSAVNLPFQNLITNGFLKPADELELIFNQLNLDKKQHLYFSCGSGVTACVLALAAYSIGYQYLHVYDGSWTEWGGNTRLPLEV